VGEYTGIEAWRLLKTAVVAEGDPMAEWWVKKLRAKVREKGLEFRLVVDGDGVGHLSAGSRIEDSTLHGGYGDAVVRLMSLLDRG